MSKHQDAMDKAEYSWHDDCFWIRGGEAELIASNADADIADRDARIAALEEERNDLIQSIRTAIRLLNEGYAVGPLAELESALEAHGGANHD